MSFLQKEKIDRETWLAWRRRGIGSSDASSIMGGSPWSIPFETFLEKTGRISGRRRSKWEWKAMQRGVRLEPRARQEYENWTGVPMPSRMLVHSRFPQLRATLDGFNEDVGRVLEIKCPGTADHKTAVEGSIPEKYLWQCVHLLMVSGMDWLDYYSFDGSQGVTVGMQRDSALEKRLMEMELDFWEAVERDTWPPKKIFIPSNVLNFRR